MTTFQKIIKYLALAFAIFLIVSITSGILIGIYGIGVIAGLTKDENNSKVLVGDKIETVFNDSEVKKLKIDIEYADLEILKGDNLRLETNSKNIICKQDGNKIEIEEKDINLFLKNDKKKLIIYIPENIKFENVRIETGAGEIDIEKINTEEARLEIGAGKVTINNIEATKEARIEGGAGEVEILSGQINDLNLDMGVGKFILNSKLTGDNKINAGIGNLEINLSDEKENYSIEANKGIGNIRLNGEQLSGNTKYGDGETKLAIDGGIGNIDITTNN